MKTQTIQFNTLPESKIERLSNKDLVDKKLELDTLQKELDLLKSAVRDELVYRVHQEQDKTNDDTAFLQVGTHTVKISPRLIYTKVDLDFAKEHDCTKEVVDADKVKALFYEQAGKPKKDQITIPGLTTTDVLNVK